MDARIAALAADLLARAEAQDRFILAIAGPPGSGKSTLAEALLEALEARAPGTAALVPMDGFHLDNAVLDARSLRDRKGAPETFDTEGLACLLARIRSGGRDVLAPVFDRELDLARAGARVIPATARIVLVEGNYLLLDTPPWSGLGPVFDRTLMLEVPEPDLRRRLIARWIGHGRDRPEAVAWALGNDLPNARRVVEGSRAADLRWRVSE